MLAPRADRSTGTEAPMAIPIIIGSAISKVITPVEERACRIPTEAEALWITVVNTIPINIPKIGLEN